MAHNIGSGTLNNNATLTKDKNFNKDNSKPNRNATISAFLSLIDKSSASNNKNSSTGNSNGVSNTGNSNSNYQSALSEMYAQQQAQLQALQAQQRAAAQSAYNAGISGLNNAWNSKSGALKSNLNSTLDNLGRQYNASKNEVTDDANKSLREAYVNYMLNKKNLNQNLTARGVGGGAAESTMAGMYNNYGNSRNGIDTTLQDNLTSLENMYQNNIANANQQYNNAYADALSQYMSAKNQMEQNLANSIVGSYGSMISSLGSLNSDYTNALNRLLANQQGYEYDPAVNTLGIDLANTVQQTNRGTVTDYAKYINAQRANGVSDEDIARNLRQQGLDINTVAQLFSI